MMNPVIRKMDLSDIDQVLKVEKSSFVSTWTRDIFQQEIALNQHAHYYVLELEEQIIGYIGMWAVFEDAQITNIAVLPDFRGKKYGEKLFGHACKQAVAMGVERLSLEVRVSNTVAQNLYRKFGLVAGGIRKGYYTDNQEDAMVMWVHLK